MTRGLAADMPSTNSKRDASPILVTACAWLIPGWGYWLLGQRTRALTVGITIFLLFMLGILIGGIRVMDAPGIGEYGFTVQIVKHVYDDTHYILKRVDPTSADQEQNPADRGDENEGSAVIIQPFAELGERPWFAGQILCGPITLIASAISAHEAHPIAAAQTDSIPGDSPTVTAGVTSSHARSWEIGTLYTAVAGMLNLLAIIDAGFRATEGKPK